MVRKLGMAVAVLIVVGVLFFASIFAVSEIAGEVISLTTYDQAGAPHTTRIWIVDDGGAQWLRSGVRGNGWYARLAVRPDVEVVRGGKAARYRAVAVDTPKRAPASTSSCARSTVSAIATSSASCVSTARSRSPSVSIHYERDASPWVVSVRQGAIPGRLGDAVSIHVLLLLDLPEDGGRRPSVATSWGDARRSRSAARSICAATTRSSGGAASVPCGAKASGGFAASVEVISMCSTDVGPRASGRTPA